ncbi:14381_t:CDS:2, partial [Rhizophagus irregularis]
SLQDSVKETSTPRGIKETNKSKQLQNEIMERSSLFYHEYKEHDIKRDEKWLEKLKVREVDYIETIYVLENDEKKERTDTLILQDAGMDSWTLYISSSSNLLDVSKHIVKNIYKVSNWKDVGYFNMLLTSPLLVLKEMGYPVDRILQQRKLQNIADQLENENTNYEKDKKSFILNLKPNNKSVNITTTTTNKTPTITSETTQILQNQLQNAVEACRSNAGVIINQKRSTEIVNVNEESQINHCEVIPEIKFYLPKIRSMFPQLYDEASLNRFVNLLRDLASVFGLSTATIHIFYDENASSIAFNNNGELFFNLKVYTILHDEECKIKHTIYAMAYWFMTLCHELAHNIILSHNSGHEKFICQIS